jgi:cyclic beta-1,2-glucan synthetase
LSAVVRRAFSGDPPFHVQEKHLNTLKLFIGRESVDSPWRSGAIIRDELFSVERLELHAGSLAQAQHTTDKPPVRRSLNSRLRENQRVLIKTYHAIAAVMIEGESLPPAAEWFLDNYHLVDDQIRQIRDDLPPGYYRQLPKLAHGPFAGYPRVFGIAWACTAHSDSRFESEALRRFVRAYQVVQPLTIGELWAIAISLRIVLVENLRRVVEQVVRDRLAQRDGDHVADLLLGTKDTTAQPQALIDYHARHEVLSTAFLVQVVKRLRDQDPRETPAVTWLEQQVASRGTTADQLVQDEHHRQGAANITVRNIITSMHLISDVDWSEFFEGVSLVDEVLRDGTDFTQMDFATRNLYRSAIEQLARGSRQSELCVSRAVMTAARAPAADSRRTRDPGYHLIAGGRLALERKIGYRPALGEIPGRLNTRLGPGVYMAGVATFSFLTLALPLLLLVEQGTTTPWLVLLALTGAIPAIDLAVAIVNRAITRSVGATMLPGIEFKDAIPAAHRTLVAVPTLLTSHESIDEQIERLEVHSLACSTGEIYYALLTDWTDSATAVRDGDEALLVYARAGIARLNARQDSDGSQTCRSAPARFYLLHRRRIWSASEQCWMGWERKRGKLHELNRLLRGAQDTTFISATGAQPDVPAGVQNVLTLDADTRLPRETARRLIGKMAHALNQPGFDADARVVIEGYAILQPRVTPSLPVGREGSFFQRVFSSMTGIDSYDAAVADVYQDLFGQGSYSGKGIYNVDAFEAALAARVSEGSMLSHDLFEGTFARAGLVSDIEVIEDYPARYDVAAVRNHRWTRGDWQLLPWIFGRGDAATARRARMPLLSLWKMVDNLRRSLSAPTLVLTLLISWFLPTETALVWTIFVIMTIALPTLFPVLAAGLNPRPGVNALSHLRAIGADLWISGMQVLLVVTFLAHQAWVMLDAITRTLYRLFISHRRLLEWVTAAQTQLTAHSFPTLMLRMLASVLIGVGVIVIVTQLGQGAWSVMLPFACLWLVAPVIAYQVSRSPQVAGRVEASAEDRQVLRLVARRTWRYFETFVTTDDHMLPPDNYQEDPRPMVAHRTSPTNIGLYLLCIVSARDFGWIGLRDAISALEATLATMQRLKRFRGHLYNWYDTRDLRPLEPQYVSSVDSGNLAGHLITVANACREWHPRQSTHTPTLDAVHDAALLSQDAVSALSLTDFARSIPGREVESLLDRITSMSNPISGLHQAETISDPERAFQIEELALSLVTTVQIVSESDSDTYSDLAFWVNAILTAVRAFLSEIEAETTAFYPDPSLANRLDAVENLVRTFAQAMDFAFLLDPERKLLSIGYRETAGTLDPSCYDLLASEARLASFLAIAKGDAPTRHWFRLGRAVTPVAHGAALISWSGSMFEYLMPSLIMRAPAGSLLEHTNRLVVKRQIAYAASLGLPWGISESAYNARDLEFTYQYSNFGVPGLGLKRGLNDNVVIAPYATGLAAMIDPQAAVRNFKWLTDLGARGRYGFFEALDYTRSRLPEGVNVAIVRAFMAHHQGMTVVALANVLFDGRMRERFHAEPSIQATELLLQESTPRDVSVVRQRVEEVDSLAGDIIGPQQDVRRLTHTDDATPQTHLLSNGRYNVMITSAGAGYSHWRNLAITRWREDTTLDDAGSFIYLRDLQRGTTWSATLQPSGVEPDAFEATFVEDRAEFIRNDSTLTTTLEIVVSPEDDAEVRRVSLINHGTRSRDIEITSYCELVLAPTVADLAHLAFSKLFVVTEFVAASGALLATRRRRTPAEQEMWVGQQVVVEGEILRQLEFETDRARFIGRGHDVHDPLCMTNTKPLSNTVGTVLDPVFVLRHRIRVEPGASASLSFWTVVASSREGVLDLLDRHYDPAAYLRAATLAWTHAQAQLLHLGIDADQASLFQRLAGHVLYTHSAMRASSETILRGGAAQSGLWALAISGDLPLVVLRIDHVADIAIARQLLQAHEYWRLKQLAVDVVILNDRDASYVQDLQNALEATVRTSHIGRQPGYPASGGSVSVLRSDLITPASRSLLLAAARVVLVSQRGSLEVQLDRRTGSPQSTKTVRNPAMLAWESRPAPSLPLVQAPTAGHDLQFFNGMGGFSADGKEYVITLMSGRNTPMPWINVIANPQFGFQVAAEGSGYTWSQNSRENQLTAWSNDPVSDRPGEVLYIRDEESGVFWTPLATPIRDDQAPYVIHHGQGYSRFTHSAHGIESDLLMFVPVQDPVKVLRLRLRNPSSRPRRLSVTAYVEWVLGTARGKSAATISTETDALTGAIFARNTWSLDFGSRVAFADLVGRQTEWTADRSEFIGRHGRLENPLAMIGRNALSNRTGAGLDPCAALRAPISLLPGEEKEMTFLLGQADNTAAAQELILAYRIADLDGVLNSVLDGWEKKLGALQVNTPDPAMDLMLNRWLLYQTIVCRLWARSAFYQASGAWGFRDQLQDGMAVSIADSAMTREHLLRAAARQFPQGDVQHWWLPQTGQGVRTRISDDRIWLAYTTLHYLKTSGDFKILDETVTFIDGPQLEDGTHELFALPTVAIEQASFYEHCARGLDDSLRLGVHGLPLFGTGDWNDGLNRVGEGGAGESVWIGWFLLATLPAFANIATARSDHDRSRRWLAFCESLTCSMEREGWDGAWYRRGFFDDGTPLGSSLNDEGRIDSISQSWSAMSGAGNPVRSKLAMAAVEAYLMRGDERLAVLFTPPFDKSALEPGYVKGYPPGIRENGGQYTHAAAWSVFAYVSLGAAEQAAQLFSMLNPVNHGATSETMARYQVEPYVVAADIYSVAPHVGRGGWTWYTGAAGWLYRAGVEGILGFHLEGDQLRLAPCIPLGWTQFELMFRYRSARYDITVDNRTGAGHKVVEIQIDGLTMPDRGGIIPLSDDAKTHAVRVTLGR